ncbi:unnamed protein product [Caenorhabditis brenneri]
MLFKYNLLGIHFHFDQNYLGVRFQDNSKTLHIICKISNVQVGVVSSKIVENADEENTCSMEFHRESEDSDALLDIQKHIFETFSTNSRLYFTVALDDFKYYRYIPGVERFSLYNDTYKVEEVEELIQNQSELKAVTIFKDLEGDISPESNIFNVRNLTIQYPSRPFTDFTDHYKGRFAIFCEPSMRDAQSFIDKWLRKECCDNLKHVMLFNPTGRPFDDSLLENFGHKRIDRKAMPTVPERYPFDKNDAYYIGAGPDKFKVDGSYYAERFDGKFATIAYFWDVYIVFSVWDQRPW